MRQRGGSGEDESSERGDEAFLRFAVKRGYGEEIHSRGKLRQRKRFVQRKEEESEGTWKVLRQSGGVKGEFEKERHDVSLKYSKLTLCSISDRKGNDMSKNLSELEAIYNLPFFELISKSRESFLQNWPENSVQLCSLLSVKTGGCSENCGYCSQSAHHKSDTERKPLMTVEEVLPIARRAKENGSTRFCMGAAWKGVQDGEEKFEQMLDIVRAVRSLEIEVCVTLGELGDREASRLKEAGVTAYNHNIDTSPEHYQNIVTTHSFEDRLRTISSVQKAGMSVCCGGILGMGESEADRLKMLEVLCGFSPEPESVPINCLVPIEGTPLENSQPVEVFELIRLIATARIALPKTKIRLSAGRSTLSKEAQALCFFAGANSIFYGEHLLTTPNPQKNEDLALLETLGLKPLAPFAETSSQ